MTPQPTAAAMRVEKLLSVRIPNLIPVSTVLWANGLKLTMAQLIDHETHLPELIAFVKEWRNAIHLDARPPLMSGSLQQFAHEADQLLTLVDGE